MQIAPSPCWRSEMVYWNRDKKGWPAPAVLGRFHSLLILTRKKLPTGSTLFGSASEQLLPQKIRRRWQEFDRDGPDGTRWPGRPLFWSSRSVVYLPTQGMRSRAATSAKRYRLPSDGSTTARGATAERKPPQLVLHVFNSTPSGQLPNLWHNRSVHDKKLHNCESLSFTLI